MTVVGKYARAAVCGLAAILLVDILAILFGGGEAHWTFWSGAAGTAAFYWSLNEVPFR